MSASKKWLVMTTSTLSILLIGTIFMNLKTFSVSPWKTVAYQNYTGDTSPYGSYSMNYVGDVDLERCTFRLKIRYTNLSPYGGQNVSITTILPAIKHTKIGQISGIAFDTNFSELNNIFLETYNPPHLVDKRVIEVSMSSATSNINQSATMNISKLPMPLNGIFLSDKVSMYLQQQCQQGTEVVQQEAESVEVKHEEAEAVIIRRK